MSALGQKRTSERALAMSALPPKADMAPSARAVHQVKATYRHYTELIPPPPHALKLAPPIPNAQACRRALADCTGWAGAITSGAISSPLVSAAANAKMLVTPRGRDATRGMVADKPVRRVGR